MGIGAIRLLTALAAGIIVLPHSASAQEVIYLVRHSDPPSTLNLDEILDETPLSPSGQQRAKMLAERLKDAGITAIYASQAKRTFETAEPLAMARGLEIRVHPYDDTDRACFACYNQTTPRTGCSSLGIGAPFQTFSRCLDIPGKSRSNEVRMTTCSWLSRGGTKLRLSCIFTTEYRSLELNQWDQAINLARLVFVGCPLSV